MTGTSTSTCACDFVFDYNFTQHIFEPTNVKGNVATGSSPCVSVTNLTIHPLSSDHFTITFDLFCNATSVVESKSGYVFNFCKADYDGITTFLSDSDFCILYDSSDIEYVWFLFKSFIY